MPEGPSIVILKETVAPFKGKKILSATGNATFDKTLLENSKILDFKSWGKHFIIETNAVNLRVHFLLFGSYSINAQTKPDRSLRLCLAFKSGAIYFYTCAIKVLEELPDDTYDWSTDVMHEDWNPARARKKIKSMPERMVCDILLDQHIFSGVGNIIKNEVLYRIKLHPETLVGSIPPRKLTQLINEARIYSFDFLEWKKKFVLKKHWLAHTKKWCKRCDTAIVKQYTGLSKRRSFFCESCQKRYA